MRDRVALAIAFLAIAVTGVGGFFQYKAAEINRQTRAATEAAEQWRVVDRGHVRVDNAWGSEKADGLVGPTSGPHAQTSSTNHAAGIWCDMTPAPGETMAALYVEKATGPVLGLNGSKYASHGPMAGHDLAFYLADGRPFMQVRRADGTLEHIACEELADLVLRERAKKEPLRLMPERKDKIVH